jgi:hypothetical protein
MCTYLTERVPLSGSAKGQAGWFTARTASVYLDHPFDAPLDHAVCIDVLDPDSGPSARVAVELDVASARALAEAILATISAGELASGKGMGQRAGA